MLRHPRLLTFALALAALLCACGRNTPAVAETKPAGQPDPLPLTREADDTARFLSGLPGTPGSPFAELEAGDAWKEHQRVLDAAWQKARGGLIKDFSEFQKGELNDAALQEAPVFYPFGGPDALTATLFFPRSPLYVMVALEPAGTLPGVKELRKKNLEHYLTEVRTTVASALGRSFFVTREMDRQFRGQVTDGLLLPILHLLVRTNHTIVGFRYVRLDDQGAVVERAANYHSADRYIGNKGFELEYRTDADQSVHRLYYFSVNLSNERLRGNRAFLTYAAGLKGATTLLKATSYMTHKPEFSVIRDLVIATSGAVLQDDSGIPYHWFAADVWKVQLYGDYERPYGSFRWLEQPDLRKAYHQAGTKPLAMPIGYGYRKITANLLFARRLGPAR